MGYYDGLGGRLVNSATNVAINNTFTCEAMDRNHRRSLLRQLERDLHDPRQRLPRLRRLHRQADSLDRRRNPGRLHGPRRQRQPSSTLLYVLPIATYEAYNTFGGKSLYFGTRRRQHRPYRHQPRRQGLLRPPLRPGRRPAELVPRPRLQTSSPGWRSRATTSSYTDDVQVAPEPGAAARTTTADRRLRPLRVLVAEQQFKGFLAAREAGVNIASFSRQHRLLEGPLRGRQPHPRLLQDGRGQRLGRQRLGQPERLGPGRDQRHRRRRPRPRRDRRHRRRQPAELDHDLPRQRRAARRPRRPARRPRRPRHAGEPALRGHVRRRQRLARLPDHGPGRQRQRRIRRRPHLAQHRHLREQLDHDQQLAGRLGVGRDPDPGPVPLARAERGQARLRDQRRRPVSDNSWIQDEGRLRNTAPPARPARHGRRRSATRRRAGPRSSPAARCTGRAGSRSEPDERIQQATYNIFSDMGAQPNTPEEEINARPGRLQPGPQRRLHDLPEPGENRHDASPSTPRPPTTPTARSPNTNGTSTATAPSRRTRGTKATTTHSYSRPRATYTVRLRVTDNGGATDLGRAHADDHQQPAADGELHGDARR